ncbi:MAG: DUF3996 domain-containing protein [Spirochaetes bacterium]|nr:DUF3996 domain-containing protein [Spirochaetota bacterium]
MKRSFLTCIFFTIITSVATSSGAAPKVGIGAILGDPSGFTAKLLLNNTDALCFGIGPSGSDGFYLYLDYLRHFRGVFPLNELSLYLGAGAGLHHHDEKTKHHEEDEVSLEARLPVGISYMFHKVPVEVFLELAPALEIIPDIDFDIRGGIGARYFF